MRTCDRCQKSVNVFEVRLRTMVNGDTPAHPAVESLSRNVDLCNGCRASLCQVLHDWMSSIAEVEHRAIASQ